MTGAVEPVIKWSGSKRLVAKSLAKFMPPANRLIDPFVGGGAILAVRKVQEAIAGDVISQLIELWRLIQMQPDVVASQYERRWTTLQVEGHTAYYDIRDRFNQLGDPHDFLFLSRTCVNGLIRFNRDGGFNNSLHHTRKGISPARLQSVITNWHQLLQGVSFQTGDYRETLAAAGKKDFVFLDPPYAGTRGRYKQGVFDVREFLEQLDQLNCAGVRWMLTFDGHAGQRSYGEGLDRSLYKCKFAIPTGNAPFNKVMDRRLSTVMESVYTNYEVESELLAELREKSR